MATVTPTRRYTPEELEWLRQNAQEHGGTSGDPFAGNEASTESHWRNLRDGVRVVFEHPQGHGLGNAGVVTVEAEYAKYNGVGGYPDPVFDPALYDKTDGYYGLVAYLFPTEVGIGKFQVLAKYGTATFDYDVEALDIDFVSRLAPGDPDLPE